MSNAAFPTEHPIKRFAVPIPVTQSSFSQWIIFHLIVRWGCCAVSRSWSTSFCPSLHSCYLRGDFFSFVLHEYLNAQSSLLKPNVLPAFVLGETKLKTCQANWRSTDRNDPLKWQVPMITLHSVNTQMGARLWKGQCQSCFSGSPLSLQSKAKITGLLWVACHIAGLEIFLSPLEEEDGGWRGGRRKTTMPCTQKSIRVQHLPLIWCSHITGMIIRGRPKNTLWN